MDTRRPYPSDLTGPQWTQVSRFIPAPKPGGRPAKYDRREIVNALLYVVRTGCQWRALPHDLPPWRIVYWYFTASRTTRARRSTAASGTSSWTRSACC